MHIGFQRLQSFLVAHTEMLFLIHHQQAEIGEFRALRQKRMGANHDIDIPALHAFAHFRRILGGHEA